MHKNEYIDYLKSSSWKERRKILIEQADNKCSNCGKKANHLHHLNYNNLGCEILNQDVIALCKDCHNEVHGKGKYGYGEYRAYY